MGSNDSLMFGGQKDLGVDINTTHTSQKHTLGTIVRDDKSGKEFVYIQANGAIAANDIVAIAASFDCAPLSAAGTAWAVAQVAIADNSFGFVQVRGVVDAAVETGPAAGARLGHVTGSNGYLNDQATPGVADPVFAIQLGAQSSNVASVYIV